ncbi:Gfo/Idh/MocA family protein [Paenibacillus thalictri]|uniref:Gfo/Idh/MocA family oxidoreductase n=1 Tax=Paenibacillus thalictri TaxID=2527873 RepID=A0A4Q9DXT4_9BACL|nr:Gfo/Idh/MocA family oxidoreductase [Paenibacillus thalictri]TBL81954.1 Gfo/Idh/MocA family oxidoreductase [Paenibacillus thalictri]
MSTLTAALVGTGGIANALHIPAHHGIEGSTLKWVCDLDENVAKKVAEQYGIPNWTGNLQAILADPEVDWVDVAVPNRFHESVTVQALEAGKHVLCQKPMADSAEAALRMVDAAKKAGRQLGIYMCFRGDPGLQLLRRLIREGAFGGIISLRGKMISAGGFNLKEGQWRMDDASGALDLLGIHMIDLFAWLHSEIEWVQAYTNTLHAPMKGDDVTTAIYGLSGGVTAVMETTYSSYIHGGTPLYILDVNGTAGSAQYILESGRMTIQLKDDFTEGNIAYQGGTISEFTFAHTLSGGGALPHVHQAFVDALRDGKRFDIDGMTGYRAIRVMDCTREAAAAARKVII